MNTMILQFGPRSAEYQERPALPRGPGIFAVVKTTYELHGLSRPSFNGSADRFLFLPDTCPYTVRPDGTGSKPEFVPLVEDLVQWYYQINKDRNPGFTEDEYRKWFLNLTKDDRWKNNRAGSNTPGFANYITKFEGEPMRDYFLLTGRATIKLRDDKPSQILGTLRYPFEVINVSKGYEQYDPNREWWLFYTPTQTGRSKIFNPNGTWTGKWNENLLVKFHQYNYNCITPIMLNDSDTGWVAASDVRILNPDEPTPALDRYN